MPKLPLESIHFKHCQQFWTFLTCKGCIMLVMQGFAATQGWKAVGQLCVSSGLEIACYGGTFSGTLPAAWNSLRCTVLFLILALEVDADMKYRCRVGRRWADCACPVDLR